MNDLRILTAQSNSKNASEAIKEIAEKLSHTKECTTILFVSSHYDIEELSIAISSYFQGNVVGCTTSGELSSFGYPEHSISAVSFNSPRLSSKSYFIEDLNNFKTEDAENIANDLFLNLKGQQKHRPDSKAFGLLLIDGLSIREEIISSTLQAVLDRVPFFGGSAGDDLKFEQTFVLYQGKFHKNAAIFQAFITDHPFEIFKTQHFIPLEDSKLVITKADVAKRIVYEINGLPAREEYARLIGKSASDLNPTVFSNHPIMIKIGGEYYVRSIQTANEDTSLTFYCAIDEGLVLTVAKGEEMIESLDCYLKQVKEKVSPKLILACECILRRLEIIDKDLVQKASALMEKYGVIGFHTYGEQINGLHVNQTLTGLAIGE